MTMDPNLKREVAAVRRVVRALEPLGETRRTRVLLHAILCMAPSAFSNDMLLQLCSRARGTQAVEPPPKAKP